MADETSPNDAGPRKSGRRASRRSADAVGACPACGSPVVDREKCYGCSGRDGGCRFAIWKIVAGKKVGARAAKELLRDGRTGVIKGFTSKAGKRFDARLKLEAGEVRFDFDS